MLPNAYLLAKIGADTAENERNFAEICQKVTPESGFRGLGVDEAELLAVALYLAGANVRVTRGGKVVKIEGYMCQKMSKGMSAYLVES